MPCWSRTNEVWLTRQVVVERGLTNSSFQAALPQRKIFAAFVGYVAATGRTAATLTADVGARSAWDSAPEELPGGRGERHRDAGQEAGGGHGAGRGHPTTVGRRGQARGRTRTFGR